MKTHEKLIFNLIAFFHIWVYLICKTMGHNVNNNPTSQILNAAHLSKSATQWLACGQCGLDCRPLLWQLHSQKNKIFQSLSTVFQHNFSVFLKTSDHSPKCSTFYGTKYFNSLYNSMVDCAENKKKFRSFCKQFSQ